MYQIEVNQATRDPDIVRKTCERLGMPSPYFAMVIPVGDQPLILNLESGESHSQNQQLLRQFIQFYKVERIKSQLAQVGYEYNEEQLENGAIEIVVRIDKVPKKD